MSALAKTERVWGTNGTHQVPYWVYTDEEIYRRELKAIFGGASWSYVGLEAEIPNAGDFKRSQIGETSVIVVRDRDGVLHVLKNQCAHRGLQVCRQEYGNARAFQCPYHQWSYRLNGDLSGVPFMKGVDGHGGMPEDFDRRDHGLTKLRVAVRNGVIFATESQATAPLDDYLGPKMLKLFDRVFDGRKLNVLGVLRQRIPANWKLMFENIKDPYHASLLHVFLVTFGLFRADNPSSTVMDETGMHSALISQRGGDRKASSATQEMAAFKETLVLRDPRQIEVVKEFADPATVVMQTIWPNLIVQQQANTLATRQIVPVGPNAFDLHWTFFGYEGDDEAMTARRLRHANLMGPAGFVSLDDSEVMDLAQRGIHDGEAGAALVEMGGRGREDENHIVTETAIRAFYGHYRSVMGL
ncbi:MAG: aromatic ring-hydroxylating dioxygenase subunit alpha [Alphaproteobacteria bacterium]|nr:aromatic ring-hydroxylating dioxygenase subunit alpha [Alphaproteobacteria bacterium]